jgi:hypothetical protein
MRVSSHVVLALSSMAFTALLTGCSGGNSQITPATALPAQGSSQQTPFQDGASAGMLGPGSSMSGILPLVHDLPGPSWISDSVKPEIYVANLGTNSVDIFSSTGKPAGSLTGLKNPSDLAVDGKGNLYVANEGAQNILVFAPGTTTPKATLNDTGNDPTGVTVDPQGNVFVANICAGPPGSSICTGNGSVYKYKAGSSTHSATYKNAAILRPYFVAFDEKPNVLWVDGCPTEVTCSTPVVGYWTKANTFTNSGISIVYPGGMQTDKLDNLAIDDQNGPAGSTLYVFANGKAPAKHTMRLAADACDVVGFALTGSNRSVWTACYVVPPGSPGTPGRSDKMLYPAGGAVIQTIDAKNFISSVAVAPASGD